MKITVFETYHNNILQVGGDFTTTVRNCDTQRRLDNAIKKHFEKLNSQKDNYHFLKGNYKVKYNSIYI